MPWYAWVPRHGVRHVVTPATLARRSLSTSNTIRYTIYENSAQRIDGLNKQSANGRPHGHCSGLCLLNRRKAHPGHVTAHSGSSRAAGMQQEQENVGPGEGATIHTGNQLHRTSRMVSK